MYLFELLINQAWNIRLLSVINSSNKNHVVSTYMTIASYDHLSRLNINSLQSGSSAGAFHPVSTQLAAKESGP